MEHRRATKRPVIELDDDREKVYKFRVLLPNGTSVGLTLHEPGDETSLDEFIVAIRREYFRTINTADSGKMKRKVLWCGKEVYIEDDSGNKFSKKFPFKHFKPYKCHLIRLNDGANEIADTFENMWDLTPDTDLLKELPEEYTSETALADLIDNSLQAVWSNGPNERRLVSVTIDEQKIMIFDTGPGMDGSDENSIVKWGKMGASLHRSSRGQAIGGKPPYLTPFFGMFGYGGPIASMNLGRSALVSAKTKESKKVYTLRLERDALLSRSGSDQTWRTDGGLRYALEDELSLSPQGSFTKVEIFEPKEKGVDSFKLQCRLKDIYFPYIQCDEMSTTGKTVRPIEFEVNGYDLAEIEGGEVAITNLLSCNGPEFVIQLRFSIIQVNTASTSPGSKALREANARLRCVYFPIVEGKENINRILEKLHAGYESQENFDTFSRVSVRRLGRLLPDARWGKLPFMEPKPKKGDKAQLLKRCCMRVKCFVVVSETDAGFYPTRPKTDLSHHHPYTTALKNFGNRYPEKENDTHVEIIRGGKPLSLLQLEKEYQDWVFQMHDGYDEEIDCGEDEPVLVVNPCNKKGLGISSDVVRVHHVMKRKGASWRSGQKVKILKGAAVGCHKNNIYATLEYILLEGFQGDVGGGARLICRPLDLPDDKGCLLTVNDGYSSLDVRGSLSIPISVIDNGKLEAIDTAEWNYRLEKQHQKAPSTIDMLNAQHCQQLEMDGALPVSSPVCAGHVPPRQIVAVVRPVNYSSSTASKTLDQKYIAKVDQEMYMEVKFSSEAKNCEDGEHIYAERVKPSSRKGFHGLYIFSLERKLPWLFRRAGAYTFSFSANFLDSADKRCEKKVVVKASSKVGKWGLLNGEKFLSQDLSVGSCLPPLSVACYDVYDNRMPFTCVPEVLVKLDMNGRSLIPVDKVKVELSSDKMTIKVKDVMVESGEIDKLRPDYKATLVICSQDELFIVRVPCRVAPGPLCHVRTLSSNLDKCLLPGNVIEKIKLEMLDAFGNHVKKGLEILVHVDGFCFQDRAGPLRKVDDHGFVDLSGLLKVTEGYGKNVSLSVRLDEKLLFKKKFQVEKRELRTMSMVPENCHAGYQLKNIVFEVVTAEGVVDESIHDEVKCGQSHTLTIKSGSLGVDDPICYRFRHGQCTIPVIKVPSGKNVFHFEVAHSHHPELHMNFKIHVLQDPKMEPTEVVESHCSDRRVSHLPDSSLCVPKDIDSLVKSITNDEKDLEDDVIRIAIQIGNLEEKLKMLNDRKTAIEQDVYHVQAIMDPELSSHLDVLVNGKELILKQIDKRGDTAAAVICNLSKTIHFQESQHYVKQDIVGIVALLGTVNENTVSRIFAEYLGEDHMLAVVCKSYAAASALEKYENDGKVDRRHALHAAATELGISINRRFLVICLEDIRPYTGKFEGKNLQRKLALPDPVLPTGKIPRGFLGYAVNMINPDIHYLHIRTAAGHGLRETLFYQLFGELQVYETRADMGRAHSCIKHGAISLDGGIMKSDGIISLGYWEPQVCFPVTMSEVPMDFDTDTQEILRQMIDKKLELLSTEDELTRELRAHEKAVKKFNKKKDWYNKLMDYKEPLVRVFQLEYKSPT